MKFEVGKTYQVRSLGDWDCIFSFEIVSRTAKTISINDHGDVVRRGVTVRDGIETAKPYGTYSLSPTIRADREFV